MADIMLPRPDNVRGRYGNYVTSDVYHIAERLQEISKHLYIQTLDPPVEGFGKKYHFTIAEWVPAVQRDEFVMRVETLDARIITACQRMLKIPLSKRLDELEKVEEKWAAEEKDRQLNELYERMGGNMYTQLERCGFIDRPVSYAKRNATARRHRNAKGLLGVPVR